MNKELIHKVTLKQTIKILTLIYFFFIFSILILFIVFLKNMFSLFLLRNTIYTSNTESELPFLDQARLQIFQGTHPLE